MVVGGGRKAGKHLAPRGNQVLPNLKESVTQPSDGEAAAKLKQLLSAQEWAELQDGGEVATEALLAAQMEARVWVEGLTYVAFTATPKANTPELFARNGPDGPPQTFHVYSMRQAIEEGFILDVLKNYTSYRLAFKRSHDGQECDEKEVESSMAMKGLMKWVRCHPPPAQRFALRATYQAELSY